MRELRLIEASLPDDPVLDTAVSRALLERVAAGELPATLRVARPGRMVAFGKQDAAAGGLAAAAEAAAAHGFEPVVRLAGGRAAVFHEDTIAIAHAVPDPAPREGIHSRFEATAGLIARALLGLGVDARVGEVPGEYCPGGYSVNARGERKLAGIGQRLVAGASHMGGVVVTAGAERVRDVLVPVYGALGLRWDPGTAGSVADEEPELGLAAVRDALLAAYSERYELTPAELDEPTLALARRLAAGHRADAATSSLPAR